MPKTGKSRWCYLKTDQAKLSRRKAKDTKTKYDFVSGEKKCFLEKSGNTNVLCQEMENRNAGQRQRIYRLLPWLRDFLKYHCDNYKQWEGKSEGTVIL